MKRTTHPLQAWLVNFGAALLFVVLFLGLGYLADRDAQALRSLDALDTEAAALEARMVRGAAALCAAEMGPGSGPGFTHDGELVCLPGALPYPSGDAFGGVAVARADGVAAGSAVGGAGIGVRP